MSDVRVEKITISTLGFKLILLDQELRNCQEEKHRHSIRMSQLQREMDELSLNSIMCCNRIKTISSAIDALKNIPEYDVIYGHGG